MLKSGIKTEDEIQPGDVARHISPAHGIRIIAQGDLPADPSHPGTADEIAGW